MKFDVTSRATLSTTRRVVAAGAIAAVAVFGAAACENTDDLEQEVRDGIEQEVEENIEEGIDDVIGGDEGDGDEGGDEGSDGDEGDDD